MYITEEKREQLSPVLEAFFDKLAEFQRDDLGTNDMFANVDATVEYVFAKVLTRLYGGDEARTALGILNNVAQEYTRRVAAPYYAQQSFDLGDTFDAPLLHVELEEIIKAGGTE